MALKNRPIESRTPRSSVICFRPTMRRSAESSFIPTYSGVWTQLAFDPREDVAHNRQGLGDDQGRSILTLRPTLIVAATVSNGSQTQSILGANGSPPDFAKSRPTMIWYATHACFPNQSHSSAKMHGNHSRERTRRN